MILCAGPGNRHLPGRPASFPPSSDPSTSELEKPNAVFRDPPAPSGSHLESLYSSPSFRNFRFDVSKTLPLLTFPEKVQHASL